MKKAWRQQRTKWANRPQGWRWVWGRGAVTEAEGAPRRVSGCDDEEGAKREIPATAASAISAAHRADRREQALDNIAVGNET